MQISKDPKSAELQKALMSIDIELTPKEKDQATAVFAEVKKVQQNAAHAKTLEPLNLGRGFVDGCFDLCHAGHFNAIR